MKAADVKKYVCLAIGVALFGCSYYLEKNYNNMPEVVTVEDCKLHQENEGKFVLLRGKLSLKNKAKDKELKVVANYPVLQRKCEVYHVGKKDGKVVKQWGESFEKDKEYTLENGKKVRNPKAWYGDKSEYFYGDMVVNEGDLQLSPKYSAMFIGKYKSQLSKNSEKELKVLGKLPQACTPKGFEYKGNRYVSMNNSNEGIGSKRIYYRALVYDKDAEYTILGLQKNGVVEPDSYDVNTRFYDRVVTMEELKKSFNADAPHAAMAAGLLGMFFVVLGLFKSSDY